MQEQSKGMPHGLQLQDRKRLTMTGAQEVVSFDDEAVVVKTGLGTLIIQGHGLQLKTLSPEGGQVEVLGTVTSLVYQEPRATGGWRRIFR